MERNASRLAPGQSPLLQSTAKTTGPRETRHQGERASNRTTNMIDPSQDPELSASRPVREHAKQIQHAYHRCRVSSPRTDSELAVRLRGQSRRKKDTNEKNSGLVGQTCDYLASTRACHRVSCLLLPGVEVLNYTRCLSRKDCAHGPRSQKQPYAILVPDTVTPHSLYV